LIYKTDVQTGGDILGQIEAFHPDIILLDIDLGQLMHYSKADEFVTKPFDINEL
jgi:DNA-binding response OmpR family regulator